MIIIIVVMQYEDINKYICHKRLHGITHHGPLSRGQAATGLKDLTSGLIPIHTYTHISIIISVKCL